jgi:hypothetical protein
VYYTFWRVKYDSNYTCNDGAGAQKGMFIESYHTANELTGGYNPFWIGDNANPYGFIALLTTWTGYADLMNGVPVEPRNGVSIQADNEVRDVYSNIEFVIRFPAVPTDPNETWMFRNGVLLAHWTARVTARNDSSHRAWRPTGFNVNIVMGGGGSVPPRACYRYIAEIFTAGGFALVNEQPSYFDMSVDGGTSHPAGSLVTLRAALRDANGQAMDHQPGWDYTGAYNNGASTPQFDFPCTNGTVREGFIGAGTFNAEFTVPIRLRATPGSTDLKIKLAVIANNGQRIGYIESTLPVTAT